MPRRPAVVRLLACLAACAAAAGSALVSTSGSPAAAAVGITGPDVASYQHPHGARINWHKVKRDHRTFAIVKATEGTHYVNPWFARDYAGAYRAGLVHGSYHFARPRYPLVHSALRQAAFYVRQLGSSLDRPRTLPPALDLEVTGGLPRTALITWAQTFLLAVRQATGRTPMIYTYPSFWSGALGDPAAFKRFPLWFAAYDRHPVHSTSLWQFSAGARVHGIRGRVDMSRWMSPKDEWAAISDGTRAQDWHPAPPGAPVGVHAWAAAGRASLSWLPGDAGTSAITGYRIVAEPGGRTVHVNGRTTHATVTGLTDGTAYTFTVTALNAVGTGKPADAGPVVPMVPTTLDVSVPASVKYGRTVRVRARLTRADTHAPLALAPVEVDVRPRGAAGWTPDALLRTGHDGSVAMRMPATRSVDLRVRYVGRIGVAPSTEIRAADVRTGVHRALSHRRMRVNHAVTLAGGIWPAVDGVTVWREGFAHGRWHVWASTKTSRHGKFAFRVVVHHRGRYLLRVVVPPTDGRACGYAKASWLHVHR